LGKKPTLVPLKKGGQKGGVGRTPLQVRKQNNPTILTMIVEGGERNVRERKVYRLRGTLGGTTPASPRGKLVLSCQFLCH